MITGNTILIIGAGQIGLSTAITILKKRPKKLILHTLYEYEAKEALSVIKSIFCEESKTEIICSYGNVLCAFPNSNSESVQNEINYRFNPFNEEIYKSAPLWKLIEVHKPDLIVDSINTATVAGYHNDHYLVCSDINNTLNSKKTGFDCDKIFQLLLSDPIPVITRYIQVLHKAMTNFNVKRYVKISTSGLGGMGLNMQYTHGDVGSSEFSTKLLGKVAAAGILNQLLWTLSHTPGIDIKVVIPNTLVGWENITTEITTQKNGSTSRIPVVDCKTPVDLTLPNAFINHTPIITDEYLEMVGIDSGENGYYGIGDMTAISALGQMGCITKEEVSNAVVDCLEGGTKYDVLTSLDTASMGPSFYAAFERQKILKKMLDKEKETNTRSVSIGNLGPKVTKHLWELEILKIICCSLNNIITAQAENLSKEAEALIMKDDDLRKQILSLQIPILFENDRLLLGDKWKVPEKKNPENIIDNIELWAEKGWIDLRAKRIRYWQEKISDVQLLKEQCLKSNSPHQNFNSYLISAIDEINTGELLAVIYSLNGGKRK